jgi:hypothetical protein
MLLLQIAGKIRSAGGAVALAGQEFGRCPAAAPRGVQPDEVRNRLQVAADPVEVLGILLGNRAAESGRDRIDKDQVGEVQDGILVVHQFVGRRQRISLGVHRHALGPQRAELQPHRRRPRAAVERERQRTLGGVRHVVLDVGDVEDTGRGRAVFLLQQHGSGGGRVFHVFAADLNRVLGRRDLLLGRLLIVLALFIFRGSLRPWTFLWRLGERRRRANQGHGSPKYVSTHKSRL